jgi:hypothetical protein
MERIVQEVLAELTANPSKPMERLALRYHLHSSLLERKNLLHRRTGGEWSAKRLEWTSLHPI